MAGYGLENGPQQFFAFSPRFRSFSHAVFQVFVEAQNLFFGLFPLGDIPNNRRKECSPSQGPFRQGNFDGNLAVVFSQPLHFGGVSDQAFSFFYPGLLKRCAQYRMRGFRDNPGERFAQDFRGFIPEDRLRRRIPEDDPAFLIHRNDGVHSRLGQGAKTGFAFFQPRNQVFNIP